MPLAVPIERTWSVNDIASAAVLNTNLRDGIDFLLAVPVFFGYQTSVQSLTSGAFASISMDTNQYDTYSGHSTTTNNSRYVAQQPGLYLILGHVGFAANATGQRGAAIAYNGTLQQTAVSLGQTTSVGTCIDEVSFIQQMAIGDYIEVQGYQTSGGALSTNTLNSSLQAIWIHA